MVKLPDWGGDFFLIASQSLSSLTYHSITFHAANWFCGCSFFHTNTDHIGPSRMLSTLQRMWFVYWRLYYQAMKNWKCVAHTVVWSTKVALLRCLWPGLFVHWGGGAGGTLLWVAGWLYKYTLILKQVVGLSIFSYIHIVQSNRTYLLTSKWSQHLQETRVWLHSQGSRSLQNFV